MKWASDSFFSFVREKFILIVVGMRFEQMTRLSKRHRQSLVPLIWLNSSLRTFVNEYTQDRDRDNRAKRAVRVSS